MAVPRQAFLDTLKNAAPCSVVGMDQSIEAQQDHRWLATSSLVGGLDLFYDFP